MTRTIPIAIDGPLPAAVIFDLDGTLVDSAADIADALNTGLAVIGVPPFPVEAVHGMIGGGGRVAIARALDAAGRTASEDELARIFSGFMARYRVVSSEGRGLYSGAHEVLGGLRTRGVKLALCTNKADDVARIALRALGIADYFHAAIGAMDGKPRKPEPGQIHWLLDELGVAARDAVLVGDSAADAGAARSAGLGGLILTSFGYSRVPVAELAADAVIDHLAELPRALARWAAPRNVRG
ncbi:MAG TPA: HAD-IA family hydrolase [Hyphomicrobiaceae bacterium]|nr:HAD-IA family hydrolase [Hyphomicrobiaceae bacterium]